MIWIDYLRVTHPFASECKSIPFDLHVLSAPPAFVLSQDQTLHFIFLLYFFFFGFVCLALGLLTWLRVYSDCFVFFVFPSYFLLSKNNPLFQFNYSLTPSPLSCSPRSFPASIKNTNLILFFESTKYFFNIFYFFVKIKSIRLLILFILKIILYLI